MLVERFIFFNFFLRLIKHFFAPFMLTYNHSKKRDLLVQLYKYNLYLIFEYKAREYLPEIFVALCP